MHRGEAQDTLFGWNRTQWAWAMERMGITATTVDSAADLQSDYWVEHDENDPIAPTPLTRALRAQEAGMCLGTYQNQYLIATADLFITCMSEMRLSRQL